ncbi:glycerate kinase [Candidatus Bathyarchaeota archaeon]|nr:glycerate kinase [Candidatus Bathyarchaeota archaeon]
MSIITNKEVLLNNARTSRSRRAREAVLGALEAALESSDPYRLILDHVRRSGSRLVVDSESLDLDDFKCVYVIGGGKAGGAMAEALETLLGDRITGGLVNVLENTGSRYRTTRVVLNEAGHPIPTEDGLEGARRMLEIAERASGEDLIICLISGGGSAMMTVPREGVDIEDKQSVTRLLLHAGADIGELNTVRKHLSTFKGGWLAKKAEPATVLSLILSDVIGSPLDTIASGPTAPDNTTYRDAVQVLHKFGLWDQVSSSVRETLEMGLRGHLPETPKPGETAFLKVKNIVIGDNRRACLAAKKNLVEQGFNAQFLTSYLKGEARQAGLLLASIACEIISSGNPVSKPAAVIVGGETTVTVTGRGIGGRNQEVALSAATAISRTDGVSFASIGTDGIDGPTDAAGAIVDGMTVARAQEINLDCWRFLKENDSYSFFSELKDLVITGATGSNVNDVAVLCVV